MCLSLLITLEYMIDRTHVQICWSDPLMNKVLARKYLRTKRFHLSICASTHTSTFMHICKLIYFSRKREAQLIKCCDKSICFLLSSLQTLSHKILRSYISYFLALYFLLIFSRWLIFFSTYRIYWRITNDYFKESILGVF